MLPWKLCTLNETNGITARSLLDLENFGDSLAEIDKLMGHVKETVQVAQSVGKNNYECLSYSPPRG